MITKPNLVASYSGLRFPTDVRVVGNYAYIADFLSSTADFKIINGGAGRDPLTGGNSRLVYHL
ncbi:MAG: hypothetical protein ACK4ZH_10125 [Dolichospermum sp.]|jgi:hypothetical protein|nr:hypothetical protein [Dolichospermum circinale Clear-D4]